MDAGTCSLVIPSRPVRSHGRTNYSKMLMAVVCALFLETLTRASAFMLPPPTPLAKSCSGRSSSSSSNRALSPATVHFCGVYSRSRSTAGCLWRTRTRSPNTRVSAALEGSTRSTSTTDSSGGSNSNIKSPPKPVVYAQEVLDRAWRSKRRIAAQGKSRPLKQRFMKAFGGRSAVFVDDREFMESTLDNVLRVSAASSAAAAAGLEKSTLGVCRMA